MTGGMGNDLIDGGSDADVIVYTEVFSDLVFSVSGTDVIVTTKSEGVDRLRNAEYIRANGVEYKMSNIMSALVDTTAPTAPTAVSITAEGGTVIVNTLNNSNTNLTANATITAGTATAKPMAVMMSDSPTGPATLSMLAWPDMPILTSAL